MDYKQLAQDLLVFRSLGLSPFNPRKDTPQYLVSDEPSTELLTTIGNPKEGYKNIPTVWFNRRGTAQVVPDDLASALASLTERVKGRQFPTYDRLDNAISDAESRSAMGGAERESLLDYADRRRRSK